MPPAKKKKHKLKPKEALPHIEGDFLIVGCDLSMRCPGFCLIKYHEATRSIELLEKDICSHRSVRENNKPHGDILSDIGTMFGEFLKRKGIAVVVKERTISRFAQDTLVLGKVTGVAEMILWVVAQTEFQELAPMTIKKLVAGNGRASKEEVAEAIDNYCSHTQFQTDDESDAVAVAIAWLIQNGYMDCNPLAKYKDNVNSVGEEDDLP